MTSLAGTRIGLATDGASWAASRAEALKNAGATVELCGPSQELLVVLSNAEHDLLVLADAAGAIPADRLLKAVRSHLSGRPLPVLVLLPPRDLPLCERLMSESGVSVLSAEATEEAFVKAVAILIDPVVRLRALEQKLLSVQQELQGYFERHEQTRERLENVEHDLKTPLNAVVGLASNLRDGIDGQLSSDQQERAAQIVKVALGAAAIVEQTLDTARVPLPEHQPSARAALSRRTQRSFVELGALAREAAALLADEARRRDIKLKVDAPEAVHLWADPVKLSQAFTNLVANAVKFTPQKGTVSCSLRRAPQAKGSAERQHAELRVSDTGPGIPRADQERIFQRGVRLAQHSKVAGRGLGLAVCKEVVDLHRGRIWVEDAEGGGATFVVALPTDLRTRSPAGLLVVRESEGVERVNEALKSYTARQLNLVEPKQIAAFLDAAKACEAMVVLPNDGQTRALESTLDRLRRAAGPGPTDGEAKP